MPATVLVSGARTPVSGRSGALGALPGAALCAVSLSAALERARISAADVGQVVVGHDLADEAGRNMARRAALAAGLSPHATSCVPSGGGCAPSLGAIAAADELVRSGEHAVVVACCLETLSPGPRDAGSPGLRDAGPKGGAPRERSLRHVPAGLPVAGMPVLPEMGPVSRPVRSAPTLVVHGGVAASRKRRPAREAAAVLGAARLSQATPPARVGLGHDGAVAVVVMNSSFCSRLGLSALAEISAYVRAGAGGEALTPVGALAGALAKAGAAASGLDRVLAAGALLAGGLDLPCRSTDGPREDAGGQELPFGASGLRILLQLTRELRGADGGLGAALCGSTDRAEALLVRGRG